MLLLVFLNIHKVENKGEHFGFKKKGNWPHIKEKVSELYKKLIKMCWSLLTKDRGFISQFVNESNYLNYIKYIKEYRVTYDLIKEVNLAQENFFNSIFLDVETKEANKYFENALENGCIEFLINYINLLID